MSARVKGHALRFEGRAFGDDGKLRDSWDRDSWRGRAKCSCGEMSESLDTNAARKKWHREHKAAVLAGDPR